MIRTICLGLAVAFAVSIVVELIVPMGVGDYMPWWHHTTAFFAVFGLVICVAMLVITKALGKAGLQQPEPPPEAEARAPWDPAEAADETAAETTPGTTETREGAP